jgi:hypothetical protein
MEISIITYSGGDSKIYRILLYYQNESSPTPGKIFRKGRLKIELKSPVIKIPFYYTMTSRNYIINTKLLIEHVHFQLRNVNKQLRSQGFRVRTRERRVFYVKFQETLYLNNMKYLRYNITFRSFPISLFSKVTNKTK